MKMHAEKKHKCLKCNNGYSTEWDLKRHLEDCGKTYKCTCGCPYASRAALLSHVYRMGHEIPTEHRHVICINCSSQDVGGAEFALTFSSSFKQNSSGEKAKDGENVKRL